MGVAKYKMTVRIPFTVVFIYLWKVRTTSNYWMVGVRQFESRRMSGQGQYAINLQLANANAVLDAYRAVPHIPAATQDARSIAQ